MPPSGRRLVALAALALVSGAGTADASTSCTWTVLPRATGMRDGVLNDVAASSPQDVWSVGTVIEHWDGGRWSVVPDPPIAATHGLYGVAAVAADEAWVVGKAGRSALIERWNGRSWRRVAGAPADKLDAVAADAAGDVWAVGTAAEVPVIVRWDGSAWRRVRPPTRIGRDAELRDVTVLSAADVWIVGDNVAGAFALRWDGRRWRVSHLRPPPSGRGVAPSAVTAVSPRDVRIVGWTGAGSGGFTGETWGVTYRWTGAGWVRRVPDYHGSFLAYDAVAALSPAEVWIAANDTDPGEAPKGTQLFAQRRPSTRTQLGDGQIVVALASDGRTLWGVGRSGRHWDPDYGYTRSRPLIVRLSCG